MPCLYSATLPCRIWDAYLARIGYTGSREPNLETLNALIYAHQLRVPFENMSGCAYGETVYLDIPHVFEKVVSHAAAATALSSTASSLPCCVLWVSTLTPVWRASSSPLTCPPALSPTGQ